jgi:Family of unknown function (DUF6152)
VKRSSLRGAGGLCASCVVALASGVALAHHSAAMFDDAKIVELRGTVKELQWTNPHIWLQVLVPSEGDGSVKEWSFEGGSPNSLSRQGWRSTTFRAGDIVTVRLHPMKDGTAAGSFVGARFEDGHTVGRWE